MCRGIDEKDANAIKYGVWTENAFFWLSRAYVPIALYRMYLRGIFADHLTTSELKAVLKVAIGMHAIDLFGHFAFRL